MKLRSLIIAMLVLTTGSVLAANVSPQVQSALKAENACPTGKDQACRMAQLQADLYNKVSKETVSTDGLNIAIAQGDVFILRTSVPFERAADDLAEAEMVTNLIATQSLPLKNLCHSTVYDDFTRAGGRYETHVLDKNQKKWVTIPLDCDSSGKTVGRLENRSE